MTSSETPTEKKPPPPQSPSQRDWRWYGGIASVIVAGWLFIAFANRMHFTAPVVFISLGWVAVVLGVVYLWQTGTATTFVDEAEDPAWFQPTGAVEELEREKRSLLKAIKEVEFDRELGKMSEADAKEMTHVYRQRAIDVLKAIDEMRAGGAGNVRDQIAREVRARLAVGATADKAKAKKKKEREKAAEAKTVEARKKTPSAAGQPAMENAEPAPESTPVEAPKQTALEALAENIEAEDKAADKPADAVKSEAS
jgi:hypothetical protein